MTSDPRPPVPFIGLTGGMGSGKSTALEILGQLGAVTISADAVVHDLYRTSVALRDAVVGRWGSDVAPGGEIDRQAVAKAAFADPEGRAWLEQQIWPLVGQKIWEFRQQSESAEPAPVAAVVETPLLFEAGMESAYDATIAVVADDTVRAQRTAERGHAAAGARDARQLSQQEKAERATYVVHNDGSLAELEQQLRNVLAAVSGDA